MNSPSCLRLLSLAAKRTGICQSLRSLDYRPNHIPRFRLFQQSFANLSNQAESENAISGEVDDTVEQDEYITNGNSSSRNVANIFADEVLSRVNTQISENTHGRLFAVVLIFGVHYKITTDDIICISGNFPARISERICLEKVMMVGSKDFTIVGRPLLSKDLIRIEATLIEKTYCVPRPIFRFIPRRRYRRLHWFRTPYTLLRINTINFRNRLDELPTVEGIENRII